MLHFRGELCPTVSLHSFCGPILEVVSYAEITTLRKNTYDSFPLVVLGFMFDIGEEESHFLKQFYLGAMLGGLE